MNYSAKTVFIFGLYMILEGLILLFVPNLLLSLVGLPQTNEVWVRFVGMAFIILGYYYTNAARKNLKDFFGWTVQVRVAQFLVSLAFVYFGLIGPVLLLFTGIEFLSGLWTFFAMRKK